MKLKIFSAFLALTLLMGCFAVTASAEEITQDTASARSTVCYNLHGQYCIIIPGSLMMTNGDVLNITADYLHLSSDESVQVSLNAQTFAREGDYFKIENGGSGALIDCKLFASTSKNSEATEITSSNYAGAPIVTFTANDADTVGKLQVVPQVEKTSPAGAYTGSLVFDIALVTATATE